MPDFGRCAVTPGSSRSTGEWPSRLDFGAVYLPLLRFGCPTERDPTDGKGMSLRVGARIRCLAGFRELESSGVLNQQAVTKEDSQSGAHFAVPHESALPDDGVAEVQLLDHSWRRRRRREAPCH